MCTFALTFLRYAQMAELVDALVSNTSGFKNAKYLIIKYLAFFLYSPRPQFVRIFDKL